MGGQLATVQRWLSTSQFSALIIPSTDEFLHEFAPPCAQRLRWATGFEGSSGTAIIARSRAALFLDGRYLAQGTRDLDGQAIIALPATPTARREWIAETLGLGESLAIDPWLHSHREYEDYEKLCGELGIALSVLATNPIDALWQDRPAAETHRLIDYPLCFAGLAHQDKITQLSEHIGAQGLEALLIADPEDLSWLLNVRIDPEALPASIGAWPLVPSCQSRALVRRDGSVSWYVESQRLAPQLIDRDSGSSSPASPASKLDRTEPDRLIEDLREAAQRGAIGFDPLHTPAALTSILSAQGAGRAESIAQRRWRKHPAEVAAARDIHLLDSLAIVRFMAWLAREAPIAQLSEFAAAEALDSFRRKSSRYLGPSMPSMSASGPSGALPHYVPADVGSRFLGEHPIYWIDSGGQYLGGSTDNTITLALGVPEARHVKAHTAIVKSFVALATARFPAGTSALQLDAISRMPLWQVGMDFNHAVGHGVGNYLNIHEGPVIGRTPHPLTLAPIEPGMIVANEPGYYAEGDFGMRIESHLSARSSAAPGFIEFDTISRLPIDPTLVDFAQILPGEKAWLADYHGRILGELMPHLEPMASDWLKATVAPFITH
jgi:Xaa-Pro aminopeptidase